MVDPQSLCRRRTKAAKPTYQSPPTIISISSYSDSDIDTDTNTNDICCEECGSEDKGAELLLCDKCDRGYHLYCLNPILVSIPKDPWFCPLCSFSKHIQIQTKIVDFFRIQKACDVDKKPIPDTRKRKKRSSSLVMSKKSRKLLPFSPTEAPERRMEQMASLATALIATRTEFSNELTYIPGMAPRSANRAALEKGGMQVSFAI